MKINKRFLNKLSPILLTLITLTSCYASGNLGVIQKINDAGTIIEGISKTIKNKKD